MRKSRFSEQQIPAVLREQEAGATTAGVCRRHGVSEQTFCRWKAKYGGMSASDATKLKSLERAPAEEAVGGGDAGRRAFVRHWFEHNVERAEGCPRKKLRRPAERREVALRLMAEHGLSQRRASALAQIDPKTVRRNPVPDSPDIRGRLRVLAGERRRFGYRRSASSSNGKGS